MPEQRRIGFRWHLRQVMAAHNLWKSVNGGRKLTPLRRVGSKVNSSGPRNTRTKSQ
jgi:hypothetical protein